MTRLHARSLYRRFASCAFVVLVACALSGCHFSGTNSMNSEQIADVKERPNPKDAYRIVMTIENAPGPFAFVEGAAQYDVTNDNECGRINRVAGTISRITTNPPIQWEKRSDTEYVATVYTDLMIDDDYYGRGVCHWEFTEARGRLKATGAEIETVFVPGISAEQIRAGQAVTSYFWNQSYPADRPPPSNGQGFSDFGQKDLETVPINKKGEFFSITLTPSRMTP
jgi:hypothetical protein